MYKLVKNKPKWIYLGTGFYILKINRLSVNYYIRGKQHILMQDDQTKFKNRLIFSIFFFFVSVQKEKGENELLSV